MIGSNDIKEIKELMAVIKVLAVSGAKIGKDGKVGPSDLLVILELLKEVDTFKAGFTGLKDLPSEVKDIDELEAGELLMSLFDIIKSVKAELA